LIISFENPFTEILPQKQLFELGEIMKYKGAFIRLARAWKNS